MKRNPLILILSSIVIVGTVAFTVSKCSRPPTALSKLRIGYLPIAAELPLFVAIEQGYFNAAGFDVELHKLASSNELVNAGTAHRVDIMSGAALNVVLDSARVSGEYPRLFLINPYSAKPRHVTDYLLVRSNDGSARPADLIGKRIAGFPGSVRVLIFIGLGQQGLRQDTYQYVELAPTEWGPALQSGAIDAVVALEPVATQLMKDGIAKSIFDGFYASILADMPLSGHWFTASFFERASPEQKVKILNAYQQAVSFCQTNEQEARGYLAKYANVRQDILSTVGLNPWIGPDDISEATIEPYMHLLAEHGAIQEVPPAANLLPSERISPP